MDLMHIIVNNIMLLAAAVVHHGGYCAAPLHSQSVQGPDHPLLYRRKRAHTSKPCRRPRRWSNCQDVEGNHEAVYKSAGGAASFSFEKFSTATGRRGVWERGMKWHRPEAGKRSTGLL